jgi:hypothetical protein
MNENQFGYRIRQALNEGLERLDYKTIHGLAQARSAALARHRPAPATIWRTALQPAEGPPLDDAGWGWAHRLGLVAPVFALMIGFVAIYQWQQAQRISQLADLDFAVLLDEAPISAYADQGFSALLRGEADDD